MIFYVRCYLTQMTVASSLSANPANSPTRTAEHRCETLQKSVCYMSDEIGDRLTTQAQRASPQEA
jgi:hypothetical protein